MDIRRLHAWDVTPKEAVAIQRRIAPLVRSDVPVDFGACRLVAGVDVSVKNRISRAAVVVLTWPDLAPVETATAEAPTPFPYVPGLLTFREGPVLEKAFAALRQGPDIVLVDGSGIAHPRRIGIAAHLGLMIEKPTIGCSKTRLWGRHEEVADIRGAAQPLVDNGETIGMALRTRAGTNPVFVSPGHLCNLDSAVAAVLAAAPRYRLPEPIRAAHTAAGRSGDDP